jgi:hypothetical protein
MSHLKLRVYVVEQTVLYMLKLFCWFHILQDIKNECSSGKQAMIKCQN